MEESYGSVPTTLRAGNRSCRQSRTTNRIAADIAQKIVEACVAEAKAAKRSVTVFVLSPDGEIMHAHRMDGQNWVNSTTAYQKAKTALHLGASTREGSLRYNNPTEMVRRLGLDYLLIPGGLPIIVEDVMIGAIGVGGSAGNNFGALDEECGRNALITVLGPQPPIAQNAR
jgi:uncharacterized protein GlcG (DUF336 family)